ncbi:hypothetical protein BVRB_6g128560 [Beta vulgaris subsp. vulgaris]|nr:hypothetical protein BVRB_6g128560 [Beta vulgaris subsp. vulgaris]
MKAYTAQVSSDLSHAVIQSKGSFWMKEGFTSKLTSQGTVASLALLRAVFPLSSAKLMSHQNFSSNRLPVSSLFITVKVVNLPQKMGQSVIRGIVGS